MYLDDKVILLTGATGSFGHTFCKAVLANANPHAIRALSRDEDMQWEMRQEFKDDNRLRFQIGDIRDVDRLRRAMAGVDYVVHAAAMKQVPTCEYDPREAYLTNIQGTQNVIDAAIDCRVRRGIFLSTDKSVHASNLYGATKLVAEKLFVQGNVYSPETRFACVRYGNVMGSRGSVIPLFLRQRTQGCLTITDERMCRFWITKEEGVHFVIDCLERMHGGEIFVPKIGRATVAALADAIAPDTPRKITGIRPGEKLSEVLITEEEARHSREFDSFYVIDPELPYWGYKPIEGGKPLPDGFQYASDRDSEMLSVEELKNKLKTCS